MSSTSKLYVTRKRQSGTTAQVNVRQTAWAVKSSRQDFVQDSKMKSQETQYGPKGEAFTFAP